MVTWPIAENPQSQPARHRHPEPHWVSIQLKGGAGWGNPKGKQGRPPGGLGTPIAIPLTHPDFMGPSVSAIFTFLRPGILYG